MRMSAIKKYRLWEGDKKGSTEEGGGNGGILRLTYLKN